MLSMNKKIKNPETIKLLKLLRKSGDSELADLIEQDIELARDAARKDILLGREEEYEEENFVATINEEDMKIISELNKKYNEKNESGNSTL
jgi:hypothetical protein